MRLLVYIIYCYAFIICILLLADNADVAYKFILNFLSFIRRLLAFQYEILLAVIFFLMQGFSTSRLTQVNFVTLLLSEIKTFIQFLIKQIP